MEEINKDKNIEDKQLMLKENLLKSILAMNEMKVSINKPMIGMQNVLKNINISKIEVDLTPLLNVQKNIYHNFESINKISQYYVSTFSQLKKSTEYFTINIQEILKSYTKIIKSLDKKKLRTSIYLFTVEENKEIINRFIKEEICPPINWIGDGVVFENNEKSLREELISSKYEKQYARTFKRWNKFHDNVGIINTISEIEICFANKMYNVAAISMCTVIDFLSRNYLFDREDDPRYRDIKNRLKPLFESIKLGNFYNKFINKNLYSHTDKKQIFSRHELAHGCEFEFDAELTCLNLIFICDLIHSLVIEIA